ncbi:MAG: acyltransferase [Muribaculaceae bacterium]|nr:acyltransferase [Muribaculaceae bacterium]
MSKFSSNCEDMNTTPTIGLASGINISEVKKITEGSRSIWIDWLRVAAIFFVIIVHSTEPFYLGGEGSLILSKSDAFWVSFFDSFARACVPLFIIGSSYLQFPLHYNTKEFFLRRAIRILIPFAVWTGVYAFIWGEPIENFRNLLLNFNYAAGHLWFVYMLLGIYLLMPMLSPWAEKVSRNELLFYLSICLFTSFIPFIREISSGDSSYITGPSGIPAFAKYPLWGECSWNSYGVFYYLSGFIGYILLGLYIKRFVGIRHKGKSLLSAILTWMAGFAISFGGFYWLVNHTADGVFPIEGSINLAVLWETPWFYDSTGVVLMAIGWIFMFRRINAGGKWYSKLIFPLAKASYGVYLCHMIILAYVSQLIREWLGTGADGIIGFWTTPAEIVLTAVLTFTLASAFSHLVGKIPGIGKYLMG